MATIVTILAEASKNEASDLYPHLNELIMGAISFAILFFFIWKWVLPRINVLLDERRQKIQGELERAEQAKTEADKLLADYRKQLAAARGEANGIIEEARRTADQLRADIQARAEQEAQATVARAQDEIRAERDRVFQELKTAVGEIAVGLAGKVVGAELDKKRHEKLIDDYITEIASSSGSTGNGIGG